MLLLIQYKTEKQKIDLPDDSTFGCLRLVLSELLDIPCELIHRPPRPPLTASVDPQQNHQRR